MLGELARVQGLLMNTEAERDELRAACEKVGSQLSQMAKR